MPHLTVGLKKIAYQVRASRRARRLSLTVRPEGVEVVVPPRVAMAEVLSFVDAHRGWVHDKVAQYQSLITNHGGSERLQDGVRIPFRGEPTPLAIAVTNRIHPRVVEGDGFRLELPSHLPTEAHEAAAEKALTKHLRRQARTDALMAIERFGPPNDLSPSALRIKDQKRRWGSCTHDGVINLNWRLIMAPVPVFDYVVVHELCHLRHRHHQPPFWRLVGEVMPDFEHHRHWLRVNGQLLTLKRPTFDLSPA